ncbi:hypothetical protein OG21DRAFT_795194 [Imleria badia]|nr:hypothetical protein OG21DRAFT_795194 [Imleria badia]
MMFFLHITSGFFVGELARCSLAVSYRSSARSDTTILPWKQIDNRGRSKPIQLRSACPLCFKINRFWRTLSKCFPTNH